jgi:phage protein D
VFNEIFKKLEENQRLIFNQLSEGFSSSLRDLGKINEVKMQIKSARQSIGNRQLIEIDIGRFEGHI